MQTKWSGWKLIFAWPVLFIISWIIMIIIIKLIYMWVFK